MKWEEMPLGEVLRPDFDSVPTDPSKTYQLAGVFGFGRGLFIRGPLSGANTTYKSFNRLRAGQFVISIPKAWEGAVAEVTSEFEGLFLSPVFPTFSPNPERLHCRYLAWYFRQPLSWEQMRAKSKGIGARRESLSPDQFLSLRIPLPPVDEQRRIVAKLDAAAERIARIEAAQFANAENFNRVLAAEFHRITSNAPRRPMREVAPLVRRPVKIEDDKEYPELGVRSFGRGTFHKPALSAVELGDKRIFWIKPGDLVFSNVFAWEGAVAVSSEADDGRVGSHRFMTCVVNAEIATSNFLRFFYLSEEGLKALGEASPGGAGRNRTLGITGLEAIEIPVSPIPQQHAFDALCEKFARLRAAQQSRTTDLIALLPALLDRAFKGEL
jgi:type I restriction enzyme, S subunit